MTLSTWFIIQIFLNRYFLALLMNIKSDGLLNWLPERSKILKTFGMWPGHVCEVNKIQFSPRRCGELYLSERE